MKEFGQKCKSALSRDIAASTSPSRVLNLCAQHAQLFEHIQLDDKEGIIKVLETNLTTEISTSKSPFGSSKLIKVSDHY